MLITCPNCHASYTVAESALGEGGRQVRCAKCKEVWHAAPPAPVAATEEWQLSVDEWQPSTDEWKPSTDEWQPSTDQPSGEASTAEHVGDAGWPQNDAAFSADPPHIDDAPPVVPAHSGDIVPEAEPTQPGSAEYAEARRRKAARHKAQKDRGLGVTAGRIAVALALIVAGLFIARESVVRQFPQTASLYKLFGLHMNVRGLDFAGLKTSYETQDGKRILIVEGAIRNISGAKQPVSSLRYTLRNAAGVEVYAWIGVPDLNALSPGETTQFRTRLASPPNDGRDVRVSFVPNEPAQKQ